jgi:hypothetical protein
MDLSKIQFHRNQALQEKYKKLGLSQKEIEYREYQRKYYELHKKKCNNLRRNRLSSDSSNDLSNSFSSSSSSSSDNSHSSSRSLTYSKRKPYKKSGIITIE